MVTGEDDSLVAEALRADPERSQPAILAPPQHRAALLALVLLNQELGRVPEAVSQTLPGLIRFQWWREALEAAAAGEAPPHPVALTLAPYLQDGRLKLGEVLELVEAREGELEGLAPEDLAALKAYVAATAGRLQGLWLDVLHQRPEDGTWRPAAERAGLAYGLLGVVRAIGHQAKRERVLLPRDLLDSAGITPAMVVARQGEERLAGVIARIVESAEGLIRSVADRGRPPRHLAPAFLLLVHARHQARALRAADYDPVAAAGVRPQPFALLRMATRLSLRRP